MTTLKENIENLTQMILEGKILEAFEMYYAEEIMMQENMQPPSIGKTTNRKKEEVFVSNITEFRSASVKNVIVGENMTAVEWHFDFDHVEWGTRNYHQLAVQRWKDGKIVAEHFIYNN